MRLDIKSVDRVGMTQEILAVFAKQQWNIKAMEVTPFHTYLHLADDNVVLAKVEQSLSEIDGIDYCQLVSLLPGERKTQHLAALLAKIPDPILDIDRHGKILVANRAALDAIQHSSKQIKSVEGSIITSFTDCDLHLFFTEAPSTLEIIFAGSPFFADITPVTAEGNVTGAVIVLKSLTRVGQQLAVTQQGHSDNAYDIVGKSDKLSLILMQSEKFSAIDLPVLITGETGTGKELIARKVHEQSKRANKPFLAINCAALPEHLLESELFGYAPGAFSGAQRTGKPGLFELAAGGTVFLDEIGEMSVYLQAKLLRFLQDFSFRRVGGTKELKVDVRIISATHQDLIQLVEDHKFREDLYYRLNVLQLNIPALRERASDIPLLVEHFCHRAIVQLGCSSRTLASESLEKLMRYSWPGNVRQLQNVLFRAVALSEHGVIQPDLLILDEEQISTIKPDSDIGDWQTEQGKFEAELLRKLLIQYPTTRKLAERLGVSHNKIAMKLRAYNLS